MDVLLLMIFAVSLRAFLFEIKFSYLRHVLKQKHRLFDTFLSCSFCNGFWCGVVTYLLYSGVESVTGFITMLFFSISTGAISYYLTKAFKTKEEN